MSDAAITTIVTGIVTCISTLAGLALVWLRATKGANAAEDAHAASVGVHSLVMDDRAKLLARIAELERQVGALSGTPNPK